MVGVQMGRNVYGLVLRLNINSCSWELQLVREGTTLRSLRILPSDPPLAECNQAGICLDSEDALARGGRWAKVRSIGMRGTPDPAHGWVPFL